MAADTPAPSPGDEQAKLNAEQWLLGEHVGFYATTELRPVESLLLERHRDTLSGDVLELGSGAGRLTGHLCELARSLRGLELAPAMVAYCRRTYPQALVEQGDLLDLSRYAESSFGAVVAPYNVLDVLGDEDRRSVLDQVHRVLAPEGLLIMSSHNRGLRTPLSTTVRAFVGSPRRPLSSAVGLVRRLRNRWRMRRLERDEAGYALVNDQAHDFTLLHYYITRDAQAAQLAEHGFALLECLDLDGREVPQGADAADCGELHYVARAGGEVALAAQQASGAR